MVTIKRADEIEPGDRIHWNGQPTTVQGSHASQVTGMWWLDLDNDIYGAVPADRTYVVAER